MFRMHVLGGLQLCAKTLQMLWHLQPTAPLPTLSSCPGPKLHMQNNIFAPLAQLLPTSLSNATCE